MQKPTHAVDTNVLLRWWTNDHRDLSPKAARFWARVERGECRAFLTEAVLAESYFTMLKTYRVPRTEIAALMKELLSWSNVVVDRPAVISQAIDLLALHNLSLPDTLVIASSLVDGYAIESFDAELLKVAKRSVSPN